VISIVIPCNRVGGIDVLASTLREQSLQDFELILVDELRPYRRGTVPQIGRGSWHIGPNARLRWSNYMRQLNIGLELARGELVLFLSDYTALSPETLATHAAFHATADPKAVMLGGIEYTSIPPLHPDFPRLYGWSKIGHDPANYSDATYAPWLDKKRRHELYEEFRVDYERDLDSGRLAPFMTSVFETDFAGWKDTESLKVWERNMRGPPSQFMNLKNDSMRTDLLRSIGGFDERADGTHGHQDSITHRQLMRVGATFHPVPEAPAVRILDPHGIAIIRRTGLDDDANLKIYAEVAG